MQKLLDLLSQKRSLKSVWLNHTGVTVTQTENKMILKCGKGLKITSKKLLNKNLRIWNSNDSVSEPKTTSK